MPCVINSINSSLRIHSKLRMTCDVQNQTNDEITAFILAEKGKNRKDEQLFCGISEHRIQFLLMILILIFVRVLEARQFCLKYSFNMLHAFRIPSINLD